MSQLGFFESPQRVLVDDESGRIVYDRDFLEPATAVRAFEELQAIPWRSERRTMYDREVDVPRLVASMRVGEEMPEIVRTMLVRVHARTGAAFNSIGFNLYRDGRDSVAPHNDTIADLVEEQPIALVSLGATRRMTIRSKALPRRAFDVDLEAGSLLVMSYRTQETYDHAIPKTKAPAGPRISVAFRVRA